MVWNESSVLAIDIGVQLPPAVNPVVGYDVLVVEGKVVLDSNKVEEIGITREQFPSVIETSSEGTNGFLSAEL